MPPIRKPGIDKIHASPKSFLSKSASSGTLQQEFLNHPKVNLSNSCFGAIRTVKDDDLTSLNWLQNRDILKGFDVAKSVPPMSPPDDGDGELTDLLLRRGDVNGDSSSEHCSNKKKSPSKPPYSFSSLIFMAIEESSGKRLPVKDIYSWIMEHFPYFRDAPLGWKNSVRHNLSLNKCFKKVDKEKGQVCCCPFRLWCTRHASDIADCFLSSCLLSNMNFSFASLSLLLMLTLWFLPNVIFEVIKNVVLISISISCCIAISCLFPPYNFLYFSLPPSLPL